MKLTFDEAIENHRKMWNWIADETEKRKKIIVKEIYFIENNLQEVDCDCFCCQYSVNEQDEMKDCRICPIEWGTEIFDSDDLHCLDEKSHYWLWRNCIRSGDWQSAAKYARQIANLPARKEARR